ncbi:hypothetical protein ELQ90_10510 [Labedella phragmitis]|uniref:IPT/TIG domain-containing protein n=1 Tax=Labedella phragmitis TaxID=2498849 RepID=A0A3S3Z853_9MICO|nr:hypothetical protein [Labedella phragmitis]RWZ49787.1 hypothetical protein ELQ90_10510 [Labedella phragmitis]
MPDRFPLGAHRVHRLMTATTVSALAAGAIVLSPLSAPSASAEARVTIEGASAADPEFATSVTVSGSGFQSITGGFGGVYVLFGWVAEGASWRPSNGGEVGSDYRYVPDQEAKENKGFQRFVAFPGSDTEDAANAVMEVDGSWRVDMVVPGATFESQDRGGGVSEVDCLAVRCGIITIGAHGVKNANNETFTPIEFGSTPGPSDGASDDGGEDAAAAPRTDSAAAAARVGYTTTTAIPGQALSFTGQGFSPGELIVATLDDGVSAVGPLTAGPSGEIAGVLPLPADLRVGTHLLTLTGAASGKVAESDVTVSADATAAAGAAPPAAPPTWPYIALGIAILVALVLLLLSIVTSIRRVHRGRRLRRVDLATGAEA